MANLFPDDLLLDLSQIAEMDREEFSRQKYRELFIDAIGKGVHTCHDGEPVIFYESRFHHCCFTGRSRDTSAKEILDLRRVERLPWILPLIGGDMVNSECWLIDENRLKRMYAIPGKGYIAWLEMNKDGEWFFSSAYVANTGYIYKQTRGHKRTWKK